jgi:predicted transcriptional regulator
MSFFCVGKKTHILTIVQVLHHGGALLFQSVQSIVEIERKEGAAPKRPVILTHAHSVQSLLEHLVENHVSRVWVTEKDGSITRTITYSDVLRHLAAPTWEDPSLFWGA